MGTLLKRKRLGGKAVKIMRSPGSVIYVEENLSSEWKIIEVLKVDNLMVSDEYSSKIISRVELASFVFK